MSKKLFDYVIGNPPYQDDSVGDNDNYAPQVYNKFLDAAYNIANKVEMIHPGRFLFDAGSTPKEWNQRMLHDTHFKVLDYVANSKEVFPNVELPGGVAVSYRDEAHVFGPIYVFTPFEKLNNILHKVIDRQDFVSLEPIVITRTIYRITDELHHDYPNAIHQLSNGHEHDMSSNIFDALPQVFHEHLPIDTNKYIKMLGRKNGKRIYMYIKENYVNTSRVVNLWKYKVVLAQADGAAGTIGKPVPARVLGMPVVEPPGVGTTESFISIGAFNNEEEAIHAVKYIKTKFMRTLVSVLKVTQAINPGKFKYVPCQDFTSSSDIDWSKSVHEIDLQLYHKYRLDEDEINFIETHVKEMD